MANVFFEQTIYDKYSQVALYDESVLTNLVNRDYIGKFNTGVKQGKTIEILLPTELEAYVWTGEDSFRVQDLFDVTTQMTVDTVFDCSVALTSLDILFNIDEFSDRVIKPIVRALFTKLEEYVIRQIYAGTQKVVEGIDGYPTSVKDLAAIDGKAVDMKIASGEAIAIVGNATRTAMLGNIPNLIEADKRADQGVNFRNATIGRAMGVDYYFSPAIDRVARSVKSTYSGTAKIAQSIGPQNGKVQEVKLSGGVAGETIASGQILKTTSGTFAVYKDATFTSAGNATVQVSNLQFMLENGQTVTKYDETRGNILMHKDSFYLVVLPLPNLAAAAYSQTFVDSETGLGYRLFMGLNQPGKSEIISGDFVVGGKVTDPRRIALF